MNKFYFVTQFFLVIILINPTIIFAQSESNKGQLVKGHVIDRFSNAPIEGALIELLNHSPRTTTISIQNGVFELENVPVGRQRIRIEMEGYYESIIPILVDAGKQVSLSISLEEEYEGVVIVEAEYSEKVKDGRRFRNIRLDPINEMTAVSYRSFSVDDVTRYPGGLEDPARLITSFPGMYNIDDTQNFIVSRGNSPYGIRWQVEGVPIDNPHHFGVIGNSGGIFPILNTTLLANSDFLNAAFSAEYGNAFSGVFDVNMRKGNNQKFEFTGEVSLMGAKATIEGPFKKNGASFVIGYRYSLFQIIKLIGVDVGSGSSPEYQDLNFKINIPTKKAGEFSIFGIGGIASAFFPAELKNVNDIFTEKGINVDVRTQTGLAGISHKKFLSDRSYLKTTASYLIEGYTSIRDTVLSDSLKEIFYTANQLRQRIGLATTFNIKLSNQLTVRAGAYGYLFVMDIDAIDHRMNKSLFKSDDILVHTGAFVQAQYKFTPRLSLNIGLHGQYFSLNNRSWAIEPRASFNWHIGQRHQLSLGYGWHSRIQPFNMSFFMAPSLDSISYNTSNRDLGYMRSHHLVLSYNLYLAEQWALKANAYFQYQTNIPIEQVPSSFSLINHGAFKSGPEKTNLKDEGIAYNAGIELSVEKFFSQDYYGVISAAYFRSQYQGSDGVWRNTSFDVQYVLQLVVGKEFKIGKQRRNAITIDLKVNHRGGSTYVPILLEESIAQGKEVRDWDNPYTARYNPYTRIDLKVGARFNPRKKNISHYFYIDIMNVAMLKNDLQALYNVETQQIDKNKQFGLIPNVCYRIQF